MSRARALLTLLAVLVSSSVAAVDTPVSFATPVLAARYEALLHELRCLVCQNQTLADSAADLAQDLRNEVRRMLEHGDDDRAIVAFLVARYGDFVLYRPPLKATTWLLWTGPFALLALGALVVVLIGRQRRAPPAPLGDDERARLTAALDDARGGRSQ